MKTKVLIIGANGLTGQTLTRLFARDADFEIFSFGREDLDITRSEKTEEVFRVLKPGYVINCAAFTQVDAAETERTRAYAVNVTGVRHLVQASEKTGSTLIHLSTDYVFDGKKQSPYSETDPANPLNYYGLTKRKGELEINGRLEKFFIIRTAWIYGKYGNNFYHLLLGLAKEHQTLRFINDRWGSPTYAGDLAEFIRFLIREKIRQYGIWHFSNEGETTRYGQAKLMSDLLGLKNRIEPVTHDYFKPVAKRPAYSVLSKEKVKRQLGYDVPHWKESLEKFIKSMQ